MPPFDALGERLLRAGIAPRHVRRYVRELSDHLDDIMRQSGVNAEEARTRLGNDDALAAPMLARPELRSLAARFPWAIFGAAPLLILTAVLFAGIMIEAGFLYTHLSLVRWLSGVRHPLPSGWLKLSIAAWNGLLMYGAPLAVTALLCRIAIQQRMAGIWIVLGVGLICVIGGFHEIVLKWSAVTTRPDRLVFDFALAPPFRQPKIVLDLVRVAMNGVLAGAIYWLWLRREAQNVADI